MKTIKKIDENEMIAVFLQAEIDSPRFSKHILAILKKNGVGREIIENPDVNNEKENIYRANLLDKYRGFGKKTLLFDCFPSNVQWERVLLSKDELKKVMFINLDYWVKLSGGSRLAVDAAKNITSGVEVFGKSNKHFWEAAELLKRGGKFPEIILVSTDKGGKLVTLEGHLRLTVYFLRPEYTPKELEVIVGYSKDFANWGFY